MQSEHVTTPFGRRPMTLALVRQQVAAAKIKAGKSVNKWKVFRDASEAREKLGLQDRSLAVLDALLSFYPESELKQDAKLVVFPSNAQLSLRAHGIAGATLRRHLALLVEAGLITRKDSANGKRYARKDKVGEIESAFGFDLAPLLIRSEELALLAQAIADERSLFRRMKENLTISRRDVRKLISAAVEEGAQGNWQEIEDTYLEVVRRIPRAPTLDDLRQLLGEMEILQTQIVNTLEIQENERKCSTNAAHNEQHIQSSKSESIHVLEPRSREGQARTPVENERNKRVLIEPFPLSMVLKACPEITYYSPAGKVGSWRDLMAAAVVVRSTLGVSPSAYQEACEVMGQENAAVAIACILERAGHINSPGGYLRDLTRRARREEFGLGRMLMAQLRSNTQGTPQAG